MKSMILFAIAGILTAAVAARAQYTPGTGGTYVGPSTPIVPAPSSPTTPIYAPTYQPATAEPTAVRVAQPQAIVVPKLTDAQMADLTASIALYPDPLLAELFPATTFVQELAFVDRWQDQHPGATEAEINALPVDDSVKAVMHYPAVLDLLVGHLDWTQAVGLAFTYQRPDLMEAVQKWRATAVAYGNLYSSPQQDVLQAGPVILIQPPPQTQVIYVPVYDPAVVYVRPVLGRPLRNVITFGTAGFSVTFVHNDLDWRDHEVRVPRHDEHVVVDVGGPRPTGRGPVVEPKAVFVPKDPRPGIEYPRSVLTPQPDKKVVTLPPPVVGTGNPGRGLGGDAPGRGIGSGSPGRGGGGYPGRGPGGGGSGGGPGGRGGFGN